MGWIGLIVPLAMPKCLARLTKWNKTSCRLDVCMTASRVVVCNGVSKEGNLCERCLNRPTEGRYQDIIIHGLLTEPIPEISRIYGGPWYWDQVQKKGEPSNKEWLTAAIQSQKDAEEFCGPGAWKVQRLTAKELEMRKTMSLGKKGKAKAKVIAIATATKEKVVGTVLANFSPIKILYQESITEPVKMETDTMRIRKEILGDIEVWITANGLVFDCDTAGEASELIGRYVNEEFVDL